MKRDSNKIIIIAPDLSIDSSMSHFTFTASPFEKFYQTNLFSTSAPIINYQFINLNEHLHFKFKFRCQ